MKIRDYAFLLPPAIVSVGFLFLYYLESFNYDNFVFANLHFNLTRFSIIPGIFWAAWVIYWLSKKGVRTISIVFAAVFALVYVPSAIQAVGLLAARTHQMFLGRDYVVQKSMEEMYGNDYKFLNFVKSSLPESKDVVLILPPNIPPWRHTGNLQIMNSYLYPATATNSTDSATPFILISSETESAPYHLWPDFKVSAKEIIIFNWEQGEPTIIKNRDWDPSEWQDKKPWGLIIKNNE